MDIPATEQRMDVDAEVEGFLREEAALGAGPSTQPPLVTYPPAPKKSILIPPQHLKPKPPKPSKLPRPTISAEQAVAEVTSGLQRRPISPPKRADSQLVPFKVPAPPGPVVVPTPAPTQSAHRPGVAARVRRAERRLPRARIQRHHWVGIADLIFRLARQEAEQAQEGQNQSRAKRGPSHSPLPPPE